MKNFPYTHKQTAFTIIESMVAISILFVAITGPLTLLNNSIISSRVARDRVRATYLAQEGIELVRNIRDNDSINNRGWLETIEASGCLGEGNACAYHPTSLSPTGSFGVCGGVCPNMTIRPASGPEDVDGMLTLNPANPPSLFSRSVVVTKTNNNEAHIVSTVRWIVGNREQEVVVEDILLDWQP